LKKVITPAQISKFTKFFHHVISNFNFEDTPASITDNNFQLLKPLSPGMFGYSILRSTLRNDFFNSLFSDLSSFGIPLEGLHTETGPGVYEAAIAYSGILEAADRAVLFKSSVKELAYKQGMRICQVAVVTCIKVFGIKMRPKIYFMTKRMRRE